MALNDVSWHLRYYEYSFMIYVGVAVLIVGFYVLVYCLKVPANRIPHLEDILDKDPVITDDILDKLGGKFRVGEGKKMYCIVANRDNKVDRVFLAKEEGREKTRRAEARAVTMNVRGKSFTVLEKDQRWLDSVAAGGGKRAEEDKEEEKAFADLGKVAVEEREPALKAEGRPNGGVKSPMECGISFLGARYRVVHQHKGSNGRGSEEANRVEPVQ